MNVVPDATTDWGVGQMGAGGGVHRPGSGTRAVPREPRSARDLEILRSLARRISPDDAGAHNNLGVVYFNKGLYEEAIAQFERALELDPRMQVARRNLEVAYFNTGYFEELVGRLHAALEADPEDLAARKRLASAYLYGGDPGAAAEEWRRITEHAPDDEHARLQLARAEWQRAAPESALACLMEAAERFPESAVVRLHLGELHYHRGWNAEAAEALERAVALDPDLAEAYHLLAFVYGDIGDSERADAAARRAAELNPAYAQAETNLSLDRYNEARYDELVGDRVRRPEVAEGQLAHYNLGLAFRQRGLYDQAMREFERALEEREAPDLVRQAQAELHLLRGEGSVAAALYGQLLAEETGSPKLWNERGVALHQGGDAEGAERCYEQALELDRSYAIAWNNLGVARHHRGDHEGAEQAFREALASGRAPVDVHRNLGLLLTRVGALRSAIEAYRRALELDSKYAPAWSGLGAALMEAGHTEHARAALVRAVDLDPELAEARYQLAFALSATGDFQGALRETKRALELDPLYPTPRFRLLIDLQFEHAGIHAPELEVSERVGSGDGVESFHFDSAELDDLFSELQSPGVDHADAGVEADARGSLAAARDAVERGELETAGAEAMRAAATGAEPAEVLLLLGDVYLGQGLAGEALERYRAVLELDSADEEDVRRALLGAARANLDLGRFEAARGLAGRYCERVPGQAEGLRVLGRALAGSGEAGRAVAVLEEAAELLPDDPGLLTELGEARLGADDLAGAEQAWRRAIHVDGGAVAARVALGRLVAARGEESEAAAQFRAALALLPTYGEAALQLAKLEAAAGRSEEAVAVLVDLLLADPYHLDALTRLGRVLCDAGRMDEAETAFRRVLRFDPTNEDAAAGLRAVEAGRAISTAG